MEAESLSDARIVRPLNQRFIPVKVLAERNPRAIESFHVQSFPTSIISSSDAQSVRMLEGYAGAERLLEELEAPKMFPKGQEHDFGAVIRGTQPKYAFPLVNTTNASITVTSVRCSHCLSPWVEAVAVTKDVLQPNETAEFQVSLDTRRLDRPKTACIWVLIESTAGPQEFRLTITARPEE